MLKQFGLLAIVLLAGLLRDAGARGVTPTYRR
jgi:hypothetical protein